MRRSIVTLMSLAVLLATFLVGGGHLVSAQDTSSADYFGHPLVGTWHIFDDVDDGDSSCPLQAVFTGDGAYIDVDCDGNMWIGVWEPTGDRTANLTISQSDAEGTFLIRVAIEVSGDGQAFTASYTVEVMDPATGEGMGEYGPGTDRGTRLVAEAPGTPEGTLQDLFSMFEEGTPEATPAS